MLLYNFKKIFDARHDFNDSDIEVLKGRYPQIRFINIPTAWIVVIDEMLCSMRYHNPIVAVKQEFGQLIIDFSNDPEYQKYIDQYQKYITVAENKVFNIDKDLYVLFGIDLDDKIRTI